MFYTRNILGKNSREGLVVVGYQGVGKSTLAENVKNVIDLESSNFFVDGERSQDWYIPYCNIARSLCRQGYVVCVSSHKVVRDELMTNPAMRQVIVCPSLELKEKWINNLRYRYESTPSDKNYKAWQNALNCYDENIKDLLEQKGFAHRVIDNMSYGLATLLGLDESDAI